MDFGGRCAPGCPSRPAHERPALDVRPAAKKYAGDLSCAGLTVCRDRNGRAPGFWRSAFKKPSAGNCFTASGSG